MSERDYLFDPSAAPDAEVAALEAALQPLRRVPAEAPEAVLRAGRLRLRPLLVLAAVLVAAALLTWGALRPGGDELQPGSSPRSFVTADRAVTIALSDLVTIELHPDSELDFVHWRASEQARFRLRRGRLVAAVAPPPEVAPGFFVVETPRAEVIDQGCRFELIVDVDGAARVLVREGAVVFAGGQREVFVPAGARAAVAGSKAAGGSGAGRPGRGGGAAGAVQTPTFLDASMEVRKLVAACDRLRPLAASGDQARQDYHDAVRKLVSVSQAPGDTLPLYHLLLDGDLTVTKTVTEALFDLVGPPDGSSSIRTFPPAEWLEFLRRSAWSAGG